MLKKSTIRSEGRLFSVIFNHPPRHCRRYLDPKIGSSHLHRFVHFIFIRPFDKLIFNLFFVKLPEDIYWENLNVARKFLKLKYVAINIVLFFVAFFLTTPEYIVSQTDWLVKLFGETLKLPAPIVDFLPTILLWSFTALLPLLVAYSDRYVH